MADDDERRLPSWAPRGRLDRRDEDGASPQHDPIDRKAFMTEGRQLIGRLGSRIGAVVLGRVADRVAPALIRPPGAVAEEAFLDRCTRCGECIEACHQDSILKAGPGQGVLNLDTPYLDVIGHNACYLCNTPPCIVVCPTEALLPTIAEEFRLGTARIIEEDCLAHAGEVCDRCVTRCPYEGRAIFVSEAGLPVVDPESCTGCGLCAQACPVRPVAIEVDPASLTR